MATTTVTVGMDGRQLLLPPEFARDLHLRPGSKVTITILESPQASEPNASLHPQTLMGMFPNSPSLEDDYFRDKDKDKW